MRRITLLGALLAFLSAAAFAETWTGKLVDAKCAGAQAAPASCNVTDSTKAFALQVGDKTYRLDEDGNAKVIAALRDSADRMKDEKSPAKTPLQAKISGTLDQDVIKVDSVQVQ